MNDRTEQAVAADVIVALVHTEVITGAAARGAANKIGVDRDALAEALERWQARGRHQREFTHLRYVYDAQTQPGRAIPPAARHPHTEPSRPNPAPARTATKPARLPRTTPDPITGRVAATRNGFYLPTGQHVDFLEATAEQHLERAEWLHNAAHMAAAVAGFHQSAADLIARTHGAVCLRDIPVHRRPELPAAMPS